MPGGYPCKCGEGECFHCQGTEYGPDAFDSLDAGWNADAPWSLTVSGGRLAVTKTTPPTNNWGTAYRNYTGSAPREVVIKCKVWHRNSDLGALVNDIGIGWDDAGSGEFDYGIAQTPTSGAYGWTLTHNGTDQVLDPDNPPVGYAYTVPYPAEGDLLEMRMRELTCGSMQTTFCVNGETIGVYTDSDGFHINDVEYGVRWDSSHTAERPMFDDFCIDVTTGDCECEGVEVDNWKVTPGSVATPVTDCTLAECADYFVTNAPYTIPVNSTTCSGSHVGNECGFTITMTVFLVDHDASNFRIRVRVSFTSPYKEALFESGSIPKASKCCDLGEISCGLSSQDSGIPCTFGSAFKVEPV